MSCEVRFGLYSKIKFRSLTPKLFPKGVYAGPLPWGSCQNPHGGPAIGLEAAIQDTKCDHGSRQGQWMTVHHRVTSYVT